MNNLKMNVQHRIHVNLRTLKTILRYNTRVPDMLGLSSLEVNTTFQKYAYNIISTVTKTNTRKTLVGNDK